MKEAKRVYGNLKAVVRRINLEEYVRLHVMFILRFFMATIPLLTLEYESLSCFTAKLELKTPCSVSDAPIFRSLVDVPTDEVDLDLLKIALLRVIFLARQPPPATPQSQWAWPDVVREFGDFRVDNVECSFHKNHSEISLVAEKLGKAGKYNGIMCIGVVVMYLSPSFCLQSSVRVDTTHYDVVANSASSGVLSTALNSHILGFVLKTMHVAVVVHFYYEMKVLNNAEPFDDKKTAKQFRVHAQERHTKEEIFQSLMLDIDPPYFLFIKVKNHPVKKQSSDQSGRVIVAREPILQ
ncbi:6,7-dimethyl-8-ribityllumazine synthase, chloroplastic-like protein, partial [Tanacetum coccineum]